MQTKIIAGVARLVLTVAVFIGMTTAQAQSADRTDEYKAEIASIEHFNEVQREADMPEMPISSYEDWLKAKEAAEAIALATKSAAPADTPSKQDQMRQWLNEGIHATGKRPSSQQDVHNERRDRLWAMSAHLLKAREAEMTEARAWVKQAGLAEYGKTEDGVVMGLVGLQDGLPRYNITYNVVAADTISVDELWPGGSSGLSITGSNTLMGIWDGGDVLTNHTEFVAGATTRMTDKDGISPLPIDWHPTAVAGTMAAGGSVSSAKGMAFKATVWAYDWYYDLDIEMNSAYANDVRVSNHSYGQQAGWGTITLTGPIVTNCWWGDLAISGAESHYFGRYDSYCTNVDAIAYGNPRSLTVWAAGNDRDDSAPPAGSQYVTFTNGTPIWSTASRPHDYAKGGYDTITDRGLAKNVLTIGAVYKIVGGYGGTGTVNMSAFSGWGPTDDGRIKPDVVAAGVGLFTPVRHPGFPSATNYYTTNAVGSSFSSPSAAGAVGLLVDLRARLAPQHPFLSSTLKGLLIHTADEAASIGPDYRTGWGLVNADKAANLVQGDHDTGGKQFIKEVTLVNGDYIEFAVTATGGVPLKVTIGWPDPAGAAQPLQLNPTNLVLVNDLDLRVVSASGTTNLPWILNPASPSNSATKGDNYRDNVEQVVVTNAMASEQFIVRVTHKGTLVDDTGQPSSQDLSIILSGIVPETRSELAIVEADFAGGSELILWPSVVGQNYRVQAAVDLLEQVWTNTSAEISATKTNTAWESGITPDGELQFYRLIETN
ncbi:MAG TPA: S8 family serine peptidase [Anaerolineaceae bacterium]|jgi:hypothetical protein|nr:S8 family serine peptidase [Anaerolineaceae bacterium]HOU60061.1 S8 family serine peptidase [Kiritimatiellia bacterium]